MAILQLIAEEEKSLCFDFLEEKIRKESRKLIESIYADEVNQFLEKMASISNFNPQHLTISPDPIAAPVAGATLRMAPFGGSSLAGNLYFHELVHHPLKHFQQGIFCYYKIQ